MDIHPADDRPEYVHALCRIQAPTDWHGVDRAPSHLLTVSSVTQWFYCYRVGVLTRSKLAVALVGVVRGKCLRN